MISSFELRGGGSRWPEFEVRGNLTLLLHVIDGIIWCDAPDAVLDERLNQRGERVIAADAEIRSRYRAMCALPNGRWWTSSIRLDTSKEDAVLVAARYVLNLAEGTR